PNPPPLDERRWFDRVAARSGLFIRGDRRTGRIVDARHLEQVPLAFHALELMHPPVGKAEPCTPDHVPHATGHQYLTGPGLGHRPCADVDVPAADLLVENLALLDG